MQAEMVVPLQKGRSVLQGSTLVCPEFEAVVGWGLITDR